MSDGSGIEWTDATLNLVVGCTAVSPGCDHCYAVREVRRLAGNPHEGIRTDFAGLARRESWGLEWTGAVRLRPELLELPARWRKPRRIFISALGDLFHPGVPYAFVDRVWAMMRDTPQHTYQVLTKRPGRLRTFIRARFDSEAAILSNVWLGTSVEAQEQAWRVTELRETPAALRFLSCEPLLGSLRLDLDGIGWVIVGGESGPGARPLELDWIADIVNQCQAAGVPVFVKQLGAAWAREQRRRGQPADQHGGLWQYWPLHLQVREFPAVREAVAAGA